MIAMKNTINIINSMYIVVPVSRTTRAWFARACLLLFGQHVPPAQFRAASPSAAQMFASHVPYCAFGFASVTYSEVPKYFHLFTCE